MRILDSPLPMEKRISDLDDALADLKLVIDESRGLDPRIAYHADVASKRALAVVDLIARGADPRIRYWRNLAVAGWLLALFVGSLAIVSRLGMLPPGVTP